MFKGGFIQNLPKIYGLYTGGFLVFILMMAIAEQAGVTAKTIGILFVAFTVAIYALIGYLSISFSCLSSIILSLRFLCSLPILFEAEAKDKIR